MGLRCWLGSAFSADNQQILVKWSGLPDHNNPWQIECEIKPVVLWNLLRKQLRDSQRKTNAERMPASDTGSPASRRNHSQVFRSVELLQHRAETIRKSPALQSSFNIAQKPFSSLPLCEAPLNARAAHPSESHDLASSLMKHKLRSRRWIPAGVLHGFAKIHCS